MTAAEEGVLLLCCKLGDPQSRPLTMAQFRELGARVRADDGCADAFRQVTRQDLIHLGYSGDDAARIVLLLDRQLQLERYLAKAERCGICPVTRVSGVYPQKVSRHKGLSCPPTLFALGDLSLLKHSCVAVVGSRNLSSANEAFAREAGRCAAKEGLVLVSGGAVGADLAAQEACLAAGGSCIVVLPGELSGQKPRKNVLYLTEDGYDLPFSPARALHRNHLIHMLGEKTLVAQCTFGKGGTWKGCEENLRHGWSELYVFNDGSEGSRALMEQGANGISDLCSIRDLRPKELSLF